MRISKKNAKLIRHGIVEANKVIDLNRRNALFYLQSPDDKLAKRAFHRTLTTELGRLSRPWSKP